MTILEKYIQLGEIEISRHPKTNIRRLLVLEGGQQWFPIQKQIILDFMVYYLDEDGVRYNPNGSVRPYPKKLVADTTSRLNPQTMQSINMPDGNVPSPIIVEEVIINQSDIDSYNTAMVLWENAVTEYDHFIGIANSNINIFEVELNIVLYRASINGGAKFDIL